MYNIYIIYYIYNIYNIIYTSIYIYIKFEQDGMGIPLVKANYFPNQFRLWPFSRDMLNLSFAGAEGYLTSFYD